MTEFVQAVNQFNVPGAIVVCVAMISIVILWRS